jgi:hypothetical protein
VWFGLLRLIRREKGDEAPFFSDKKRGEIGRFRMIAAKITKKAARRPLELRLYL